MTADDPRVGPDATYALRVLRGTSTLVPGTHDGVCQSACPSIDGRALGCSVGCFFVGGGQGTTATQAEQGCGLVNHILERAPVDGRCMLGLAMSVLNPDLEHR